MADERDLIRSRVSIVELVSQRVALKRLGKHWKGLCPFHDDRNPSFQCSDVTGTYRCWSCGAKGDIFTWVMETQRVDFREALEMLALQAGVELSRGAPAERRTRRAEQESAMLAALSFFREQLPLDPAVGAYCSRRGLDDLTLQAWEIGFAPEFAEALPAFLKRAGHSLAECKELFLVEGEPSYGYAARFKGRLMFPIRDERGALVAFGGRLLGDGQPKYINSGDTPLYSKRRVLYGMNRARDSISKKKRAVLVEGYLDVIACHQAGVTEAVASLGTSLSEEHAKMLKRWCDEIMVLYDSDAAGQKAADRAAEILVGAGLRVRISLMPDGEDPDTLLRKLGPEAVRKACAGGLTPMEYRVSRVRAEHEPADDEYWSQMVMALASAASPIELERYLSEVAPLYPGLRDPLAAREALRKQVAAARRTIRRSTVTPVQAASTSAVPGTKSDLKASEQALFEALFDESLRASAWEGLCDPTLFMTSHAQDISAALTEAFGKKPPKGAPLEWLATVLDESVRSELADMALAPRTRVSMEVLADALADLKLKKEERAVRQIRPSDESDNDTIEEIGARLRKMKPKYE